MKVQPIKRELRDLSLEDLRKKKDQIGNFLMNRPQTDRALQGYATMDVLHDLIEAKESGDELMENVIKELCFQ